MRPHRLVVATALALATSMVPTLSACASTVEETSPKPASPVVVKTAREPAPRVVVAISVDGLNPTAITRLGKTGAPALHRMIEQGTGTLNARSARELTRTLPNHTGMLTGRRISGTSGHHVTVNHDPGTTLARVNGRYVPGIFDVAHDHGLSTALYTSKSKFRFFDRSWGPTYGRADTVGVNNGRDKIDAFVLGRPTIAASALLRNLSSSNPHNLQFWHISLPDAVGHEHGFMSAAYLRAIRSTNYLLGRFFLTLRDHPATRARTSVILTADHGGLGASHSDPRKVANFRIPFYTWGRGVTRGPRLYTANPGRYYPGTRRVGYSGAQPIRNMDAANTALRLLGLPSLAGVAAPLDTSG